MLMPCRLAQIRTERATGEPLLHDRQHKQQQAHRRDAEHQHQHLAYAHIPPPYTRPRARADPGHFPVHTRNGPARRFPSTGIARIRWESPCEVLSLPQPSQRRRPSSGAAIASSSSARPTGHFQNPAAGTGIQGPKVPRSRVVGPRAGAPRWRGIEIGDCQGPSGTGSGPIAVIRLVGEQDALAEQIRFRPFIHLRLSPARTRPERARQAG
jgi:hypothetical protein